MLFPTKNWYAGGKSLRTTALLHKNFKPIFSRAQKVITHEKYFSKMNKNF
jgi:hypothetical protein